MRFRPIIYPFFLIYELLRLCFLLQGGAQGGVSALPLTWYAAVPLLCIVPVMFFMLSFSETDYAAWLPLISLIKAIGLPSLFLYIVRTVPTAVRFGSAENFTLLGTVAATAVLAILDCAIGIYCFGRNRKLCK